MTVIVALAHCFCPLIFPRDATRRLRPCCPRVRSDNHRPAAAALGGCERSYRRLLEEVSIAVQRYLRALWPMCFSGRLSAGDSDGDSLEPPHLCPPTGVSAPGCLPSCGIKSCNPDQDHGLYDSRGCIATFNICKCGESARPSRANAPGALAVAAFAALYFFFGSGSSKSAG